MRACAVLRFAAILVSLLASVEAWGEKPESVGIMLSNAVEVQAQEILNQYLPKADYHVYVQVKLKTKADAATTPVPYLPSGESFLNPDAITMATVKELTASILIELRLAAHYNEQSKQALMEVLSRKLYLQKARGDKVTVSKLLIQPKAEETSEAEKKLTQEVKRLEEDLRSQRSEREQVARERNDIRLDLTAIKKVLFPVLLGLAGVFLFAALASMFLARSVSMSGRVLGDAVGELAAASTSQSEARDGGSAKEMAEDAQPGVASASAVASSIDAMARRAEQLRLELMAALNQQNLDIARAFVNELCGQTQTVPKASVLLESVGKEHGGALFKQLNKQAQGQILSFISEGVYSRPKLEIQIEATEELLTKLTLCSFAANQANTALEIRNVLQTLTDQDIVRLTLQSETKLATRLLSYLPHVRVASVFGLAANEQPERLQDLTDLLLSIPSVEADEGQDAQLVKAITVVGNEQQAVHTHDRYLDLYQKVAESIPAALSAQFLENIGLKGQAGEHVKSKIIILERLFELPSEMAQEITARMSNKEIATLASRGSQQTREAYLRLLPARRQGLVQEEIQRLAARGAAATAAMFDKAKARALEFIRQAIQAQQQGGGWSAAGETSQGGGGKDQKAA